MPREIQPEFSTACDVEALRTGPSVRDPMRVNFATMRRVIRSIIVLGLFIGVFAAGDHRARAQGWDNKGWVLLGEQEVGGRNKVDKDRITVGRQEGTFSKVTVV